MKFMRLVLLVLVLLVLMVIPVIAKPLGNVPLKNDSDLGKLTKLHPWGSVSYLSDIKSSYSTKNLQDAISFGEQSVFVNTSLYPELNSPATISFNNCDFDAPIVLRNGVWQPDVTPIIFPGNVCKIVVGEFSVWELIENEWNGTLNGTNVLNDSLGWDAFAIYIAHFDDNVNDSSFVTDSSENEFMANTFTPMKSTDCYYGDECFLFDGDSTYPDRITINDTNWGFETTGDITIGLWVRTTDSEGELINNFERVSPFTGFSLRLNGGFPSWYSADGVPSSFDAANTTVNDGNWHHVLVSYAQTNGEFFVDGFPAGTFVNLPVGDSSNKMRVGVDNNEPAIRPFAGQIECLFIYQDAKNTSGYLSEGTSCTLNTFFHMSFDIGTSVIAFDESGNGNHFSINDVNLTSVGSLLGKKAVLNASDQTFLSTAGIGALGAQTFVINMWVNFSSTDDNTDLFSHGNWGDHNGSRISLTHTTGGNIVFSVGNATTNIGTFDDDNFHMLTGKRNASGIFGYGDGVLNSSILVSPLELNYTGVTYLGSQNSTQGFFNGSMDEVSFYAQDFPDNQILANYNFGEGVNPFGSINSLYAMNNYAKSVTDLIGPSNSGDAGAFFINESSDRLAFEFDGDDDIVFVEGGEDLELFPNMTLSAWIYPRSSGPFNDSVILEYSNSSGVIAYSMNMVNATISCVFAGSNITSPGVSVPRNDWLHVACLTNGSHLGISLNGTSVAGGLGTVPAMDINGDLKIGSNWMNNHSFNGYIDAVRIFDSLLDSDETIELANDSRSWVYYDEGIFAPELMYNASFEQPDLYINYWHNVSLNGDLGEVNVRLEHLTTTDCDRVAQHAADWMNATKVNNSLFLINQQSNCTRINLVFDNGTGYSNFELFNFTINALLYKMPEVSNLSILPGLPFANDTVIGNATFYINDTDNNGIIQFDWFVNDINVYKVNATGLSNATNSFSSINNSFFGEGALVYFVATPFIDVVKGENVTSGNVTIQSFPGDDLCLHVLKPGDNCTMFKVLSCAPTNFSVYNLTGLVRRGNMTSLGEEVFSMKFFEGRGSYTVKFCDDSTIDILVKEEDNMAFLTIGLIYTFLTGLLAFSFYQANATWVKVVLAVAANIMITTLLRLSIWFVTIMHPTQAGLIGSLEKFYTFGVVSMWIGITLATIYLIPMMLRILSDTMSNRRDRGLE